MSHCLKKVGRRHFAEGRRTGGGRRERVRKSPPAAPGRLVKMIAIVVT